MFTQHESKTLRGLADTVRKISEGPRHEQNISRWRTHTSLGGGKPMVFVFPDGAWSELLPPDSLTCESPLAQNIEAALRKKILRAKYVQDDVPVIGEIVLPKVIHNSMWGVEPKVIQSGTERGAWKHLPIIEKASDWEKLKMPVVEYDEYETQKQYEAVCSCLGDILPVRRTGVTNFSFHLLHWYCDYRGMENLFMDLIDDPEMVHYAISFFTRGMHAMLDQIERQGLVSKNCDDTFHYTGGVGYTDNELPEDKDSYSLSDVWGAAEAQEFSSVSPDMHEEFVLRYERTILERFGLNGYGCCDDLSKKLPNVLKIKNLRRVAVCPWADIADFTPVLQKNYIMTWKPLPTHLAMEHFDEEAVRKELTEGLEKAKGGVIELVLRDTNTCRNDFERFNHWIRIARQVIECGS